MLVAMVAVLATANSALASNATGTEFNSLWDKLVGYVEGVPGKIFALGILVVGLYRSIFAGAGPLFFFGTSAAAAAIFILPDIANNAGGALF
jgi:conjugal transfer pilus assembly protein TraA